MGGRFRIEKVELHFESEGPDYFTRGEFQVIDSTTGEVAAAFLWSLEEAYLANASYYGPDEVRISEDGTEAIAVQAGQPEQRVLLPSARCAIVMDGRTVGPDTDMSALVRELARNDGPANPQGFREPGGQWLKKLYGRLGRTPMAAALVAEVAQLLDSDDPRQRGAALRFYYFLPEAPGADRVLEIADARRDLFGDDRPTPDGPTLDEIFLEALSQRLHHAPTDRVRDLVRREALRPGHERLLKAVEESLN